MQTYSDSDSSNSDGHPPAPILVKDPPSSDDGTDLEDLKHLGDPALHNGSSGNFGSAGARSAPSTPQGVLGSSPGAFSEHHLSSSIGSTPPSIQRSPSHSVFNKCDKASLKHLSTSTSSMTAQSQITDPPSPKTTKVDKVYKISKSWQKRFTRHFPNAESDEKVLNHYSCALIGDILLQGHLYITNNYFAFYSNVFGYVTKLLIPILTVEAITKEKTARIIPNAVGIMTSEDKHVFGSLLSRDSALLYMKKIWEKAKTASNIVIEPDIIDPENDTTENGEGDSGSESPSPEIKPKIPLLRIIDKDKSPVEELERVKERKTSRTGLVKSVSDAIVEFRKLPRQSLVLFATTLLLTLLFLSAAVLLYRISKIQDRYSVSLDNTVLSGNEDVYNDLLQWQTHLHSKSAGAVHSFLDTNLDQLAKVRQSLEALSTLLIQNNSPTHHDSSNSNPTKEAS